MTRENGYLLYGQNLGTEIWFFSDEMSEVRRAKSLRLVPKREISNLLASNWLKMCQTHHGQQCRPVSLLTQPEARQKLLPSLRAIDVVLNCVVEMPLHSRYLTLSYVWGDVACVRLAKGNAKNLMIENSLINFRNDLPRTITDALQFVSMIGERYLWIDTLCLMYEPSPTFGVSLSYFPFTGSYKIGRFP